MNRWRRSGNVVERSETVAQVAQAMIFGQRDLRLLSCEGTHVAAFATPLECTLTQKGGGVPAVKSRSLGQKFGPRDDSVGAAVQGGERKEPQQV